MVGVNFGELLRTGKGSDLTLVVGPEEAEFPVHRMILSFSSEFMRRTLPVPGGFLEMTDGNLVFHLPDHDPKIMSLVLDFIYKGSYDSDHCTMEEDLEVLISSIFLDIDNLKTLAIENLSLKINQSKGWEDFDRRSQFNDRQVFEVLNRLYERTTWADRRLDELDKFYSNFSVRLHKLWEVPGFKSILKTHPNLFIDIMDVYNDKVFRDGMSLCKYCNCLSWNYARMCEVCQRARAAHIPVGN